MYFTTLLLSLHKSARVISNLSISNLSTPDFKLAKSEFLANSDVLMSVALFKSDFVS